MIGLNALNKNEVLIYLGYKSGGITKRLSDKIDRCMEEILKETDIKCIYRKYAAERVSEGIKVADTDLILTGQDVDRFLTFSEEVILACVTVGGRVDKRSEEAMDEDAEKGFILDVCSSVAVETAMRELENKLRSEYERENSYLSLRFGAGYGDLPLSVQKDMAEILELDKLGITVNRDYLLSPSKTLTGIFMCQPVKDRGETCDICRFVKGCSLKKDGAKCKCVREPAKAAGEINIIEEKEMIRTCLNENDGTKVLKHKALKQAFAALDTGELLFPEVLYIADHIRKCEKSSDSAHSNTVWPELLLCTPYGDSYAGGKNIMKVIFEALSYKVTDLGTGVETEILCQAVEMGRPDYVCISILMPASRESLAEAVRAVKETDKHCRIIVSGGMLTEGEAQEMGADILIGSLKELVDTFMTVC